MIEQVKNAFEALASYFTQMLGKYATEVLASYAASILLLLALVWISLARWRKTRAALATLEQRMRKNG